MPAYGAQALTNSPLTCIYPGDPPYTVWSAESPATGAASQQVALGEPYLGNPQQISVSVTFSAAPGTFEVDIQTADVDAAANYVTVPGVGAITAVDATTFVARAEISIHARFARLLMVDDPGNVVTVIAQIAR